MNPAPSHRRVGNLVLSSWDPEYYCLSLRDPDDDSMGGRGVRKILEAREKNQLGYGGRNSESGKVSGGAD